MTTLERYNVILVCDKIVECILYYNCTIRETAKKVGMSKSYVHTYIHKYIKNIYPSKYDKIMKILNSHFETKHINGGKSTKEKYRRSNKTI